MRDSLTVLSESTEYPLCKKQAIQTEYMITHCLEGIQGPSCACINSSWSATVNLANAKKPLWNEACQALKRIPAFLCLAALNTREMFPVRPKQHWGTWAVLPRVAGEEKPCSDLVPAADGVTGKGWDYGALWGPTPEIPPTLSQPPLGMVARATAAASALAPREAKEMDEVSPLPRLTKKSAP